MEKIWSDIIIAIITALLTILVNKWNIAHEIKKMQKEKINERRDTLYTECYELLERNYTNYNIVFNTDYISKLSIIKVRMKLIASNSVLQAFKTYYEWAVGIYSDFKDYYDKHDPTDRVQTVTGPDGEEAEIPLFSEYDIQYFERMCEKYIVDRNIEHKTIKSKVQSILNAMRSDLGNDIFIEN